MTLNMPNTNSVPVIDPSSKVRITQLDVVRGFAVLGIFWINIVYMGLPYGANNLPTLIGNSDALNAFAWVFNSLYIDGSMFSLFAMLFGASALILLREDKLNTVGGVAVVDYFYRRLFWLIIFGLVNSFLLLWPLDILVTYGLLGLLLFPLRHIRPGKLLLIGLMLVVIGSLSVISENSDDDQTQDTDLSSELNSDITIDLDAGLTMEPESARTLKYADPEKELKEELYKDLAEDMVARRQGYLELVRYNFSLALGQHTTNLYEDNLFDAGGMMLIGMALFKWGVLSGARSTLFYLVMMFTGYTLAMLLRFPVVEANITSAFDPFLSLSFEQAFYFIARLPLALGHLSLIMLLLRMRWFRIPAIALAATGRMALSNYIGQTLFAIFLFYKFGFGLFGELERFQLSLVALFFGCFQLLFSLMWLKNFQMGPLESLWRWLAQSPLSDHRYRNRLFWKNVPEQVNNV